MSPSTANDALTVQVSSSFQLRRCVTFSDSLYFGIRLEMALRAIHAFLRSSALSGQLGNLILQRFYRETRNLFARNSLNHRANPVMSGCRSVQPEVFVGSRNWSFATENDVVPLLGDGDDRFRTASARLRVHDFDARLRLFTGNPHLELLEKHRNQVVAMGGGRAGHYIHSDADKFRAGVLSFVYGGAEYGISSEGIRHATQNVAIHDHFLRLIQLGASPWFNRLPDQFPSWGHYQLGPTRPFTLW